MPAPVLAKTWQYDVNQIMLPDTNTVTAAKVLLAIKNSLIGFASSPWEVWGSCDGAGGFGNGDSVDRWADITDLVAAAAGLNHSWVVLSQPGLGNNASICIDFVSAYEFTVHLSVSAGFGLANGGANGTATNRPTASDEVQIQNPSYTGFIITSSYYLFVLHIMMSTDGECTRIFITHKYNSSVKSIYAMIVDKAKNPKTEWTYPIFGVTFYNGNSNNPGIDTLFQRYINDSAAVPRICTRINGSEAWLTFSAEGLVSSSGILAYAKLLGADDYSGNHLLFGVGIASYANERGRKGEVYDFWAGYNNGEMMIGDLYNDMEFAQFYGIVVPWNGTKMIIG